MTNEEQLELIAQAREVLTDFISFQNEKIASVKEEAKSTGLPDHPFNRDRITNEELILSLATTHLAEMDEHYNNFVEGNYNLAESVEGWFCQGCYERNDFDTPCQKLLTKAKRLLGVE